MHARAIAPFAIVASLLLVVPEAPAARRAPSLRQGSGGSAVAFSEGGSEARRAERVGVGPHAQEMKTQDGFTPIFNGKDFTGWKVPAGDNGHWKVADGVIDYDAESEASGDKSLWTDASYGDFVLRLDWRIKSVPYVNPNVHLVRPDGTHKKDENGRDIRMAVPDSDSGVYLRGQSKAQVNIWSWPIGSGEVYGYRMDEKMPPAVRAGVTPKKNMDRNIGEWNTFEITMRGDRLTVVLNGEEVLSNAQLPGIPPRGPVALQHHGAKKDGKWVSPPSLVQFRNISIKEL